MGSFPEEVLPRVKFCRYWRRHHCAYGDEATANVMGNRKEERGTFPAFQTKQVEPVERWTCKLNLSAELIIRTAICCKKTQEFLRHCNSDPLWVHGGRAREARSEREQVEEQDEQEETAMSASEYSGAGKHGRGKEKVCK